MLRSLGDDLAKLSLIDVAGRNLHYIIIAPQPGTYPGGCFATVYAILEPEFSSLLLTLQNLLFVKQVTVSGIRPGKIIRVLKRHARLDTFKPG